jgi:hypothetical protein
LSADPSPNLFRNIGRAILLAIVLYVLALVFPEALFRQKLVRGQFTVFAHQPIPADMEKILDDATYRLQQSEIYDPNAGFKIFLTSSPTEFTFFNPLSGDAKGSTYRISDSTFVNQSDIAADTVSSPGADDRPLHWVIAHEATHVLLHRRYGFYTNLTEPSWKTEGYCEVIANEPAFSDADGLARLQQAGPDPPPALFYFQSYLRVKFLKERKHVPLNDIIHQRFDEAALDDAIRRPPQ